MWAEIFFENPAHGTVFQALSFGAYRFFFFFFFFDVVGGLFPNTCS